MLGALPLLVSGGSSDSEHNEGLQVKICQSLRAQQASVQQTQPGRHLPLPLDDDDLPMPIEKARTLGMLTGTFGFPLSRQAPHYERNDRLDSAAGYLYEDPVTPHLLQFPSTTFCIAQGIGRTPSSTSGISRTRRVWCGILAEKRRVFRCSEAQYL